MPKKVARPKKTVDVLDLPPARAKQTTMFTVDFLQDDREALEKLRMLLAKQQASFLPIDRLPSKVHAVKVAIRLACDYLLQAFPHLNEKTACGTPKLKR